MSFTCPGCGRKYKIIPDEPTPNKTLVTVESVKTLFPKELEQLLMFEEIGEYIIVRSRQYLGSETFAKVASLIRSASGEYVSAGKESHFKIKK